MIPISLHSFLEQFDIWERFVNKGSLLVYPTDTVYGLGGVATKRVAERINRIKNRNSNKSLSVIAPDVDWICKHLEPPLDFQEKVINATQPTTWLINKKNKEDFYWLSNNEKLGVRYLGNHPIQQFITALKQPFITTSANISGSPPISRVQDIDSLISAQVDGIINAGELIGAPSKLWDFQNDRWIER